MWAQLGAVGTPVQGGQGELDPERSEPVGHGHWDCQGSLPLGARGKSQAVKLASILLNQKEEKGKKVLADSNKGLLNISAGYFSL